LEEEIEDIVLIRAILQWTRVKI